MARFATAVLGCASMVALATVVFAADPPASAVPEIVSAPPLMAEPPAVVTESAPNPIATGPFFFGEYLLVQPHRDNLSVGLLGTSANGSLNGQFESLGYELAEGFRVGGGYRLPADGWDTTASFAYFHSRYQRTVDAPAGSAIYPPLGLFGAPATSADGDSALSYAVTDVDIGRTYAPFDMVSVRIFGGARFARLNQSLKTIYVGCEGDDYVNSPVKYLGGGLSFGSEASWRFLGGFGVYGKARFSLLAGQFDSRLTETVGGAGFVDLSDSFAAVTPVAELGTGVSYQGRHFFASVGYDLADWFNLINGVTQPDANRPGQITRLRGDLTLEGLSVKLGFIY